jgi:Holliday junction resolvase RusA-like endonuclease
MAITFTVAGDPVPQPRHKITARGPFAHAYIPAKHAIHAYRKAIAAAALAAGATPTADEPLTLAVVLQFARPKTHYNKSGLKKNAALLPRPDVSNCIKGIEDALNGVAWIDDKQVGTVIATKRYGDEAMTVVKIEREKA